MGPVGHGAGRKQPRHVRAPRPAALSLSFPDPNRVAAAHHQRRHRTPVASVGGGASGGGIGDGCAREAWTDSVGRTAARWRWRWRCWG